MAGPTERPAMLVGPSLTFTSTNNLGPRRYGQSHHDETEQVKQEKNIECANSSWMA